MTPKTIHKRGSDYFERPSTLPFWDTVPVQALVDEEGVVWAPVTVRPPSPEELALESIAAKLTPTERAVLGRRGVNLPEAPAPAKWGHSPHSGQESLLLPDGTYICRWDSFPPDRCDASGHSLDEAVLDYPMDLPVEEKRRLIEAEARRRGWL